MRTLLTIIIGLLVFTGCSRVAHNGATPQQNQSPNGKIRAQQTVPENNNKLQSQQIVKHLEQLASSIPNVQHAHCVILGKTAIVGIDVKEDLPRSRVDNIKYSVAEALRKDPHGVNAVVTADMDLDRRISNIRQEIMKGRPIAGFADELGKIIGRIMPQLPKDINAKTYTPPNTNHAK
ncbi:YhcN/YlaJ family sporulation lipoprotein [Paenibacillus psychroresistens]|uniref:YhcN/YlaJ family sporulation lipoprotein n=1 Tax=Paenibacillus psychroresistens TaxID=1778678 RepID=A0A6B8RXL3_9BACL|nr:YhcN/YlaJ family sporulation lipoprotein [Paenibacillus psychroresistens]QGR00074.1 YhcN/YlaJ family sporulation lipoprotein [Paenibacillus psychroresistens]